MNANSTNIKQLYGPEKLPGLSRNKPGSLVSRILSLPRGRERVRDKSDPGPSENQAIDDFALLTSCFVFYLYLSFMLVQSLRFVVPISLIIYNF